MIHSHVSSTIWLTLEEYYNKGVTPEQAKEAIEALPDLGSSSLRLVCESQGLNYNWNVRTTATSPYIIKDILRMIEMALNRLLKENQNAFDRSSS